MNVKFKKSDGVLTLYIYGELDEYTAISVKNTVDNVIMSNLNVEKVIFDLSGVTFMDSTGIGLLIGRYKKIKQFNISSYISGASVASERVLELAGIYQIMPRV
ncbi:MAG: anti-sigma factor antagonist [Clostridia bacterium]|nr:anti-sigma factor antagonist [Clostridia bacterium]